MRCFCYLLLSFVFTFFTIEYRVVRWHRVTRGHTLALFFHCSLQSLQLWSVSFSCHFFFTLFTIGVLEWNGGNTSLVSWVTLPAPFIASHITMRNHPLISAIFYVEICIYCTISKTLYIYLLGKKIWKRNEGWWNLLKNRFRCFDGMVVLHRQSLKPTGCIKKNVW